MTDALSWPRHLLTIEDWEALPEDDSLHFEVAEGVLTMSPRPIPWHQNAVTKVTYGITAQLPETFIALAEVEATGTVDLTVAGHPVRLDLSSLTRR